MEHPISATAVHVVKIPTKYQMDADYCAMTKDDNIKQH
jgi:hypothetical protein